MATEAVMQTTLGSLLDLYRGVEYAARVAQVLRLLQQVVTCTRWIHYKVHGQGELRAEASNARVQLLLCCYSSEWWRGERA